jgi:hypothetical protein
VSSSRQSAKAGAASMTDKAVKVAKRIDIRLSFQKRPFWMMG